MLGAPTTIVAPFGGIVPRLARFSTPYFPAPSTVTWVAKSAQGT